MALHGCISALRNFIIKVLTSFSAKGQQTNYLDKSLFSMNETISSFEKSISFLMNLMMSLFSE
jgi:hypothetical protein